ncbi:MAG: FliO/MopB family protein [Deltaproteobacteria bacterium]|nr:FliO/MopB family protein [Deltaproteobacteria bacterium]
MSRKTVSALALVATTLTGTAFAVEPARPKPVAEKLAVGAKPPARAKEAKEVEAPAADGAADEAHPTEGPKGEPTRGEADSLLPSDHREPPQTADKPLVLRKPADKPLELSSTSSTDGFGLKLGICAAIVGGAVWLLRKRGILAPPKQAHPMTILGRTAIGVRSELLLVDVDGQKLLLGVTPSSISRLAVLPVHGDTPSLADEALDPPARVDDEPGFDDALESARSRLEEFAARMKSRAPMDAPVTRDRATIAPRESDLEASRASRHASPRPPVAERLEEPRPSREAARAKARESIAERELRELRASRPDLRSRPDLGEQAQSLLKLRQARGRG